jgi:ligand-binding SRPBCC domain-containing protein
MRGLPTFPVALGTLRSRREHVKIHRLEMTLELPEPLDMVFPFFADPGNLEKLTPPWLNFEITTPRPIHMAVGQRIDYKLRLHGIPISWQSEITEWQPPYRFVDAQRRGPYRQWIHEHLFEEKGNRTLIHDRVDYAVLGGALVNKLIVLPDLRRVFAFRHAVLTEEFC